MKKNNFHLLKNRLNKFLEYNKVFTFREVRGHVKFEGNELKQRIPLCETTFRKFICWFLRANYIQRIERGRYKMTKKIPQILSTSDLEKEAYPQRKENRS